jgi:hypothetical protein
MIGEKPKYDVFISYRVNSDAHHAKALFENLTGKGLKVWFDQKCLKNGVLWEDGFCDGLVQSKVFVCLISSGVIAHATNARQCFNKLHENSACDNLLLEHQLALEFRELGLNDFIYPVFIGNQTTIGEVNDDEETVQKTVYEKFDFACYGNVPDTSVDEVENKKNFHMDRLSLGLPQTLKRTVKSTVTMINGYQAGFIDKNFDDALANVSENICDLLLTQEFDEETSKNDSMFGFNLINNVNKGAKHRKKSTVNKLFDVFRTENKNNNYVEDDDGNNKKKKEEIEQLTKKIKELESALAQYENITNVIDVYKI